ncbi:hypothetical protein JCM8547_001568 [Rhodosporidiobolus lusitaniae]
MILRIARSRPPSSDPPSARPPSWSQPLIAPLLRCLLLLVVVALPRKLVHAQNTSLVIPSTTQFNLSSAASTTFYLPPTTLNSSSSLSLSISLSICDVPSVLLSSSNSSFALPTHFEADDARQLYVSTDPALSSPGPDNKPSGDQGGAAALEYGWASLTVDASSAQAGGVWIAVFSPDTADVLKDSGDEDTTVDGEGGQWTFELDVRGTGTSVDDGGDGGTDWEPRGNVGLRVEDSDQGAVLLSTANITAAGETGTAPGWTPLVVRSEARTLALSRSRCFVRRMQLDEAARAGAGGGNTTTVREGTTTRGYGGGTRSQFEVGGLEGGTNYTAWLVQNETTASGGEATKVWDPVFFATKTGSSCRLLYDLDFCPSVAYSVPAPSGLSTSSLISFFNSSLSPSLTAFRRTLTTFPCDVPTMGQYSVVSTCDDCYAAYRDWACATTIPRCTDAPANATLNDTTSAGSESGLASWTIPSEPQTTLLRSDPFASRTPPFGPSNLSLSFPELFNSSFPASSQNTLSLSPFPYSEIPPCLDVCHLVEAKCPPFLGWQCPSLKSSGGLTGTAGYGETKEVEEGDRMVGDLGEGEGGKRDERAADRFGNVYCNALGSDLALAAQFVSFSASSSTSSASSSLSHSFPLAFSAAVTSVVIAFAFASF